MSLADNKFLTGYGVILLLATGALGYLVVKEKGRYDESQSTYTTTVTAYNNLRSKPLALTEENLTKLQAQTQVVTDTAVSLKDKLASLTIPLEEVTPPQFQDRLRKGVSDAVQRAAAANVTLPERFYLGFDRYRNQPPSVEAAPQLLRQLKAIELICNTLIDARVTSLSEINRRTLPVEGDAPATAGATRGNPQAPAAKEDPLVTRQPISLTITGYQNQLRQALNNLNANDKQFLIIRPVTIENDNAKQIQRIVVSDPVAPPPDAEPIDGALPQADAPAETSRQLEYIVGNEQLNILLNVDITFFDAPFPTQTE